MRLLLRGGESTDVIADGVGGNGGGLGDTIRDQYDATHSSSERVKHPRRRGFSGSFVLLTRHTDVMDARGESSSPYRRLY